ncbi:unnamed protein product [Rotaria sp. Silwood1]|nr:unnamed protein product [Rotaria sp. Silwood1]
MLNLEELTLAIFVQDRTFLNDTSLYNEILVYMGQLNIFNFWICTDKMKDDSIDHLSKDDIQQTFINIIFKQVECIVNNLYCSAQCHVFSLPFMFNYFDYIVQDNVPFEDEFFIRIACSFLLLEQLTINNLRP